MDLAYSSKRDVLYATDGERIWKVRPDSHRAVTVTMGSVGNLPRGDTVSGIAISPGDGQMYAITARREYAEIYSVPMQSLEAEMESISQLATVPKSATLVCKDDYESPRYHCDCPSCTAEMWSANAGGGPATCGERITWVIGRKCGFVEAMRLLCSTPAVKRCAQLLFAVL